MIKAWIYSEVCSLHINLADKKKSNKEYIWIQRRNPKMTPNCLTFLVGLTHYGYRQKKPFSHANIIHFLSCPNLSSKQRKSRSQASESFEDKSLDTRSCFKYLRCIQRCNRSYLWRNQGDGWSYQHPKGVNFWPEYHAWMECFHLMENDYVPHFYSDHFV